MATGNTTEDRIIRVSRYLIATVTAHQEKTDEAEEALSEAFEALQPGDLQTLLHFSTAVLGLSTAGEAEQEEGDDDVE